MNAIHIIGRLTRDPEYTPALGEKKQYVRLSVAVDRRYGDQTDFFEVVAFGNTADAVHRYLAKGRKIAVTGEMQSRKYQAKDGSNRIAWSILANEVEFVEPKPKPEAAAAPEPKQAPRPKQLYITVEPGDDDDVPF